MAKRVLVYLSDARLAYLGDKPARAILALVDKAIAAQRAEDAAVAAEVLRKAMSGKAIEPASDYVAGVDYRVHRAGEATGLVAPGVSIGVPVAGVDVPEDGEHDRLHVCREHRLAGVGYSAMCDDCRAAND